MSQYQDVGKHFDRTAQDYDSARRQLIPCFEDFYGEAVNLVLGAWLTSSVEKPNVIDLGAGSGLFASLLLAARSEASATLIDLSPEMLELSKLRFNDIQKLDLIVSDYTDENLFKHRQADAVISALSIHHLSDVDSHP